MNFRTPTFRWTEEYSVNVVFLDQQHERLFTIVNELNQALADGEGGNVIEQVLQKLDDYVVRHFADEEAVLAKYQFPGIATHRAEHDEFNRSMAKFLADHRAGKQGVSVSLMLFLQSWLKKHILIDDKAYSSFLSAQGVR